MVTVDWVTGRRPPVAALSVPPLPLCSFRRAVYVIYAPPLASLCTFFLSGWV